MELNAGQIFDVFDDKEIDSILTILDHLPDAKNKNLGDTKNSFYAYTNGFMPTDLIYNILNKKVFKKNTRPVRNIIDSQMRHASQRSSSLANSHRLQTHI